MKRSFFLLIIFLIPKMCLKAQLIGQQTLIVDSLKGAIGLADHDTVKLNRYKKWDNIIYISVLSKKVWTLSVKRMNKRMTYC